MKKLLLVLFIAIIPAMAFAQFQIGATALYSGDVATIGSGPVSASDFTFGGEARLKIWILQASALAYYVPAGDNAAFVGMADAGLSLDIWFLRIGAGVGANAIFDSSGFASGPDQLQQPYNLKATADINLGPLSIGVEGIYLLTDFTDIPLVLQGMPSVGVTVMLKLF